MTAPKANLRDQVAYESGLLTAQHLANEAINVAQSEGRMEVADALAALSTDILVARLESEAWRAETIAAETGERP